MTGTSPKSIARDYMELLANTYKNNFKDSYTPIDYILEHGQSWGPRIFPKHIEQGPERECFRTSALLATEHPELRYVEGYATAIIPTEHAWLVDSNGNVIDPTWGAEYSKGRCPHDYFGVAIPIETVLKICLKTRRYGVFDFIDWDKASKILGVKK